MGQRIYFFIVVLLLIFQGAINGQQKSGIFYTVKDGDTVVHNGFMPGEFTLKQRSLSGSPASITDQKYIAIKQISPVYYRDHSGFFCQKEWQLEKITFIPFRFRLGSVDYVNWMEKKPNAVKLIH